MTSRYNTTRKDMSTMVDYLTRSSSTAFNSSTWQVFSAVCSAATGETYYHDGAYTFPVAGDKCYSDSDHTTVLAAGYYRFGLGGAPNYMRIMSSDGTVQGVQECT